VDPTDSDPTDSYHAHQTFKQVYVVLRVDDPSPGSAASLASRFAVVKILRGYDEAQREVARLNAAKKGVHVWQIGRLAPGDGAAPSLDEAPPASELERLRLEVDALRSERDSLRAELERARSS
jgi:hypothetical protein